MDHKISFEKAAILIKAYIDTYPTQSRERGLYGYFNISPHLDVPAELFYYLTKSNDGELFFGMCETEMDPEIPEDFDPTDGRDIFISNSNGKYDRGISKLKEVKGFLKDSLFLINDINARESLANIKTWRDNYKSQFLFNNTPANEFPYGAMKRDEFGKLIKQGGIGIRCFWGFDATEDSNKIRLIIFAVDNDGKNLCKKNDNTDYLILEKSWPPGRITLKTK